MPNMAKFSVLFSCSGGKVSLTGQFTILLSVVEDKESKPERTCLFLRYLRGSMSDC